MLTVVAFIVALGVLIAIHEYGHYRVAVACGVKVLRFSVGFGKTIFRWKPKNQKNGQDTEFVICLFPLGGYVKMLDEREAPVDAAERHLAFNTQPLKYRAAVVAAGPIANLLLAIFLYSILNWSGLQEPKAVLASPIAGSVAEKAGLRGMELVKEAGFEDEDMEQVRSFEDLRWRLMQGALNGRNLRLVISGIGPDLVTAKELVSTMRLDDIIDFTGHVSYENVPEVYRSADLFVSPTWSEGFSNTILEAMASGLPIVAARAIGVVDCLTDRENALFHDVHRNMPGTKTRNFNFRSKTG